MLARHEAALEQQGPPLERQLGELREQQERIEAELCQVQLELHELNRVVPAAGSGGGGGAGA